MAVTGGRVCLSVVESFALCGGVSRSPDAPWPRLGEVLLGSSASIPAVL